MHIIEKCAHYNDNNVGSACRVEGIAPQNEEGFVSSQSVMVPRNAFKIIDTPR